MKNRAYIIFDEDGKLGRIVADQDVEIYWIRTGHPHDVYKYGPTDISTDTINAYRDGLLAKNFQSAESFLVTPKVVLK